MIAICFFAFASSAHVPNVPWRAAMETHTKAAQHHLMKIRKYQERIDFHIEAAGKLLDLADADKAATANKVAKKNRKSVLRKFTRCSRDVSDMVRHAEAIIEAAEETAALRTAEAVLLGNDTALRTAEAAAPGE